MKELKIKKALENSTKRKKGTDLKECFGILKKDGEWEKIKKELKKGWEDWTKKYKS